MSDPVAEKSGFLKMYMTSHPDTLVAYAKWYGKVTEAINGAEMSSIDTKSMNLTCALKNGGSKVVNVKFDPPLAGYDAVKPRLLEMKALAQEGLNMIKAPTISTFRIPTRGCLTSVFILLPLILAGFTPEDATSPPLRAAVALRNVLGPSTVRWILKVVTGLHLLEALYVVNLCRRHNTGIAVGAAYSISTFIFGLPVMQSLRKQITRARIDSVMKIQ